jgi:hypothetical protein
MRSTATAQIRPGSLAVAAISRAARLSIFGFIGWFWFLSRNGSAWKDVGLWAVVGLAAMVGITWYALGARADRRRRALDRYGEKEQAPSTLSQRNPHARPHSKAG